MRKSLQMGVFNLDRNGCVEMGQDQFEEYNDSMDIEQRFKIQTYEKMGF